MERSPEIVLIDVIFLVCREQNSKNRKSKMTIELDKYILENWKIVSQAESKDVMPEGRKVIGYVSSYLGSDAELYCFGKTLWHPGQ